MRFCAKLRTIPGELVVVGTKRGDIVRRPEEVLRQCRVEVRRGNRTTRRVQECRLCLQGSEQGEKDERVAKAAHDKVPAALVTCFGFCLLRRHCQLYRSPV